MAMESAEERSRAMATLGQPVVGDRRGRGRPAPLRHGLNSKQRKPQPKGCATSIPSATGSAPQKVKYVDY